jgi:uncharacterized protein (TIGR03067 family)
MADDAYILDGLWQMVRAELDGEQAPELVAQRTQLELSAGEYTVRFDDQVIDRGLFECSTTVDANRLVLRGTAGPNAGRTIPCIFQRVGDRLRICYGLSGAAPTGFTTAGLRQCYLATYRRSAAP